MSLLVVLGAAVLALVAARGRPLQTLSVLVGTVLLVPATMVLPGSPTALLTVTRLVEGAAVVGVLRAPRPAGRVAMPRVLLLLLLYAGLVCVTGVALASSQIDPVDASYSWVSVLDQVLVALVVVELARRLTAHQVLLVLAVAATLSGAVGVLERITGRSWARTLLQAAHADAGGVPAQPLEHRNGAVRVRGATEFALAYGWLMVALFPAAVLAVRSAAGRWGVTTRAVLAAGVVLVAAGGYLSRGRSPLLVLLLLAVGLLVLLAPRTPAVVVASLAGLGLAAVRFGPLVVHKLAPSADRTSVDVRVHRLPQVLDLGAAHPFRGNGLTAISRLGPGVVDSSYLQVYVEAGAVAAVLLVLVLLATTLTVARGAWGGLRDDDGLLALAAAAGMGSLVVGTAFFDAFTTLSTGLLFWVLAGAGLVAAQRRAGEPRLPALRDVMSPLRLGLVVLAVAVGLVVRALTPVHATAGAVYATVGARAEFLDAPQGLGRQGATTLCQAAREMAEPHSGWHLDSCEELGPPGRVRVRVTGRHAGDATRGIDAITSAVQRVPHLAGVVALPTVDGAVTGVPTAARAAPVALGLLAAAAVVLVPRRRRYDDTVSVSGHDARP